MFEGALAESLKGDSRSYLTGRLVKSGPTKVGLVTTRFHPVNS